MSIGLPLLETAKRSVHGSVRSPDGERRHLRVHLVHADRRQTVAARHEERVRHDAVGLDEPDALLRCSSRRCGGPVPEFGGSGGPDGPVATQ